MLWNVRRNKKTWNFCKINYIKAMETYCVSCKKSGANEISNVWITKRNRLMLLPNCAICGKKKSTFIKSRTFKWLV